MIGVLYKPEETRAVGEFFQLFKTPWEPFSSEENYDVVITTGGAAAEVNARLLLVFCARPCPADEGWDFHYGTLLTGPLLEAGDLRVPAYRDVLTFASNHGAHPCVRAGGATVGLSFESGGRRVMRLGYDLFGEVRHLLSEGQPPERATVPSLDHHIELVRRWILETGIPVVEIPPSPAGFSHSVCLTHDIDFIGIRRHLLDHTMWGFAYRATVQATRDWLCGRISAERLRQCWMAVLSLPLVYFGLMKDFWLPFEWLMEVEHGLPATYFLIPFKRRAGRKVQAGHPKRRAASYDVTDIPEWTQTLARAGCEIGVHGIDGWHSAADGIEEMRRVVGVTGGSSPGVRTHWLLRGEDTFRAIEEAGYRYDATEGYNETPGYRAGTSQVYRPLGARHLLELPLHIQDGALFFPQRLGLSEQEAWDLCGGFLERAARHGGVLTILWHDRSHAPERFWGGFYIRLLRELRSRNVWFCTAAQAVEWFSARREVTFDRKGGDPEKVVARSGKNKAASPFALRIHRPLWNGNGTQPRWTEESWYGNGETDLSARVRKVMVGLEEKCSPSPRDRLAQPLSV